MKKPARKALVMAIGVAVMLIAGCGEKEPPSVKKSRTIAAENIELRKQLDNRGKEVEKLREQHGKEIKTQEKLLVECQREIETWKKKSKQNIRRQAKSVGDRLMEEIEKLRGENEKLKAQIEELQKEP